MEQTSSVGLLACPARNFSKLRGLLALQILLALVVPFALSPGMVRADEPEVPASGVESETAEADEHPESVESEVEGDSAEAQIDPEISERLERDEEEAPDPADFDGELVVAGGSSVCAEGQVAVVSGRVQSGGGNYATDVVLLASYSAHPNDLGSRWGSAQTDASGAFTICLSESMHSNLEWVTQLRVVARAKPADLDVLGDSFSEPVVANCALVSDGCVVNVAMQPPTITATVQNASSARLSAPREPGDEWFQSGYEFSLSGSRIAVAFPFVADQYRLWAAAGGPPYFVPTEWTQSATSGQVDFGELELEIANVVVAVTRPPGFEFYAGAWPRIMYVSPTPDCNALTVAEVVGDSECLTELSRVSWDVGIARMQPGSHRIVVTDQGFTPVEMIVSVGEEGVTGVSAGAVLDQGRVIVALATPSFTLAVEGAPEDHRSFGVQTARYSDPSRGFIQDWSWPLVTLRDGSFGWTPAQPGIYQLVFLTRVGAVGKISEHIVNVVETADGLVISGRCLVDVTLDGQVLTCLQGAPRSGLHVFEFGKPDLVVNVCGIANCEEGSFDVHLVALQTSSEHDDGYGVVGIWGISAVEMSLARTGRHELRATPGGYEHGGLLRPAQKIIHLTRSNPLDIPRGDMHIAPCAEMFSDSCGTPLDPVDGTTTLQMQLTKFPLIGEVRGAHVDGGQVLPLRGIHLSINPVGEGAGRASASTNADGRFGVDLPVGDYIVHVFPQYRYSHLAESRFDLSVIDDGNGGVTASALPFVLTIEASNVVGQVQNAAGLSLMSLQATAALMLSEHWSYFSSSPIDFDGSYRFSLPPGTWRITVNPHQYNDPLALFGAGSVEFQVPAGGVVSPGDADVHLPATNLRLQTKQRTEAGELINFTTGYAQLEKETDGGWSDAQLTASGRDLSSLGWVGFAVPAGRYRLTVGSHGSSPDAVTTRRFVLVQNTPDGERVCMTSVQPSTWPENCEGWEINPTTLVMDGANIRGVVRAGGEATGAWLSVARWNGLDYEWLDFWSSVDQSGRFGLRLNPGTYRISFQPWSSSEFVETRVHLRVVAAGDGVQWCRVSLAHGLPGSSCAADSPLTNELISVELNSTNLQGRVVQAADTSLPVRGTWMRVERDRDGVWNYWQHVFVGDDGRFRTRIDNETPATPMKFRLVVDPPQHASSLLLSRRVVELWAGDFDGTGEIVLCRSQPVDGGCGVSDRVVGDLLIELDAGNLIGTVRREVAINGVMEPGAPVVGARVEFQRREHGYWNWFDYWAFTNNEGKYSADLPAGEYRITVHPPFEERSAMAPARREFTMAESDSLIQDFVLSTPNVVVTLIVPESGASVPAQGAWIYLERKRPGDEGWDFLDMHTHTDDKGVFSFHLPDAGDYRMVIHPPWNSSNAVRFMRDFAVDEAGSVSGLEPTISFPVPNLELTVHRPAGPGETTTQPMLSVHVYLLARQVHNEGEPNEWSWWRWVDGGHTNRVGEVGFLITEPGDYRVVVQAPWNRPEFVGFETEILVTGSPDALEIVPPPMPLVYPRANVEGIVRVDELRVNRFGWLIAWSVGAGGEEFRWSGHNDQSGRFGLRLDEGVYRLEAHPNWHFRDRGSLALGPIDVMVTVSAQGQVTACTYTMGGANCLVDGLIDIALDHLPPNFVVTAFVTAGVPAVGALVRLTSEGRSWDFIADSEGKVAAAVRPGTFTVRVAAIVAGTVRVVSVGDIEHSGSEPVTSVVLTLLAP